MTLPTAKHHWNLDKDSGTNPVDAIGGAALRIERPDFRPGKDGQAETCLRFAPGTDAQVVTTDLPDLAPPWTASMWIKREADTSSSALLSSERFALKLEQYQRPQKVGITVCGVRDLASEVEIPLGAWSHVVFVGTGLETKLYVDGAHVDTFSTDAPFHLPLKWVGSMAGWTEFGAFCLDELKIFDKELTSEQVRELYNEPSNTATPTLHQCWLWGHNGHGELGNGSYINVLTPKPGPVLSPDGFKALAVGAIHNLALLEDGSVLGWGYNQQGHLGVGDQVNRPTPTKVPPLAGHKVRKLSAGPLHSMAITENGELWVWGYNLNGQQGTGTKIRVSVPQRVPLPTQSEVVAVSAGAYHSLALLQDGTVLAWGSNEKGQLGIGSTAEERTTPVIVSIPSGYGKVTAIAGGFKHNLALTDTGTVFAWGLNDHGQLGTGNNTNSRTPVRVSGLPGPVTAIAACRSGDSSNSYSLALVDGNVYAWGSNKDGQLGNGTTATSMTPGQVSGLTEVTQIAAGVYHAMALTQNGDVWVWGSNGYGQLGDGSNSVSTTPKRVPGLSGIKAIGAGGGYSMAAR